LIGSYLYCASDSMTWSWDSTMKMSILSWRKRSHMSIHWTCISSSHSIPATIICM
jgi:hypothetical protein